MIPQSVLQIQQNQAQAMEELPIVDTRASGLREQSGEMTVTGIQTNTLGRNDDRVRELTEAAIVPKDIFPK